MIKQGKYVWSTHSLMISFILLSGIDFSSYFTGWKVRDIADLFSHDFWLHIVVALKQDLITVVHDILGDSSISENPWKPYWGAVLKLKPGKKLLIFNFKVRLLCNFQFPLTRTPLNNILGLCVQRIFEGFFDEIFVFIWCKEMHVLACVWMIGVNYFYRHFKDCNYFYVFNAISSQLNQECRNFQ